MKKVAVSKCACGQRKSAAARLCLACHKRAVANYRRAMMAKGAGIPAQVERAAGNYERAMAQRMATKQTFPLRKSD